MIRFLLFLVCVVIDLVQVTLFVAEEAVHTHIDHGDATVVSQDTAWVVIQLCCRLFFCYDNDVVAVETGLHLDISF